MDWLKGVGAKIAGGLVALAVIVGGISWWQMDLSTRHAILSAAGRGLGWALGCVCGPWAFFGLIGWVARRDSNAAGAALVVGLTAVEAAGLILLFHTALHGPTAWTLLAASMLLIGVYNLLACDWIAEKVG